VSGEHARERKSNPEHRPNIYPHAGTILADKAKEVVWFKEATRYFENTKGLTSIVASHRAELSHKMRDEEKERRIVGEEQGS
jgi:hypothetical protein